MKVTLIRCSGEACRQPRLSAKLLQAFFQRSSSNLDLPLLLLLLPTSRGSCCRLLQCREMEGGGTGMSGRDGDCRGREARRRWHRGVGVFFGEAAAALGWCLANQCSVEETVNEIWIFLSKALWASFKRDVLSAPFGWKRNPSTPSPSTCPTQALQSLRDLCLPGVSLLSVVQYAIKRR